MRIMIWYLLVTMVLLCSPPLFGAYKITKVIEIGPANCELAKWSPDGYRVAYSCDQSLCICDSLGKYLNKIPLPNAMERYEWLSDGEVTALLVKRNNEEGVFYQMAVIDVVTGEISILREYVRGSGFDPVPESFFGPHMTTEGVPYYRTNVLNRGGRYRKLEPMGFVFPERHYPNKNDILPHDKLYYGEWGDSGLYKVRTDHQDSMLVAPKPYSYVKLSPTIRSDWSYYIYGAALYSFAIHHL